MTFTDERAAMIDRLKRAAGQCRSDAAFWKLDPQIRDAETILREVERLATRPFRRKRFRRLSRALYQRTSRLQREVIGF